jgi:transcriptional regulator with XRE-family HTH domain
MSPVAPVTPVSTIAKRIKELRARRGWTAEKLGKELTRHGAKFDRFTISNLESGKRQNVTINELMAIAFVFDVAPVNLLVPFEDEPYQVTSERIENSDTVRAWFRGEEPLPGTDERTYFAEVSALDMRRRIEAVREQYELGPHPKDEPLDEKIAREGRRMRRQNKPLQDSGEE